MSETKRKYTCKDIEMLTACATIIENAIANQAFLQTKRANWTEPFFQDLKTKIETTTDTQLGKDAAKNMRLATQTVLTIQTQAIIDLAEFKIQIIEDYKKDKPQQTEILTQLGFTEYHKPAQNGDQEALVNLLYQYKQNINPLSADIVAKGTAQNLIDNIISYANTLKTANITQETFKGTRKEITAEVIGYFNDIYDDVISIANISKNFFKADINKKQQFSFDKIVANQNSQSTQNNKNQTPQPPTP